MLTGSTPARATRMWRAAGGRLGNRFRLCKFLPTSIAALRVVIVGREEGYDTASDPLQDGEPGMLNVNRKA